MSKEPADSATADAEVEGHDFTQIDVTHDGRILLELNTWDGALNGHATTSLRLFPGEARLFADMLSRNADTALESAPPTPV